VSLGGRLIRLLLVLILIGESITSELVLVLVENTLVFLPIDTVALNPVSSLPLPEHLTTTVLSADEEIVKAFEVKEIMLVPLSLFTIFFCLKGLRGVLYD
jgi:hypothetical protein